MFGQEAKGLFLAGVILFKTRLSFLDVMDDSNEIMCRTSQLRLHFWRQVPVNIDCPHEEI